MKKFMISELLSDIVKRNNVESGEELVESTITNFDMGVALERYDIVTDVMAKYYGKEIGTYQLLSIPSPLELNPKQVLKIVKIFGNVLKGVFGNIDTNNKVLVVGLGNRHISADSLGTKVIKKINITFGKSFPKVMAICPSVMGLTGIETYDIVSGVIEKVKPTHLIFIDSLCASSVDRLGKSIQVTNTGICPGSGIGNNRKCLGKNLCKNVYSIGVPLLIYASTFLYENFEKNNIRYNDLKSIMQKTKNKENSEEIYNLLNNLKNCMSESFDNTIVSIKDIEECVDILSEIIGESINYALGVSELKWL